MLLLSLSWLFLASPRAQGENVDSKLESSRQQMPKDQSKDYEITVPFLLNGEQWRPVNGLYSKNHPALLQFVIQAESKHLVINLERNEGLLASSFTETHYLKDGTDVVLARNYTGHCYYHGNVRGYPDSAVSLSTCSGLRGIIAFGNKSYILEPLEGATSEHKIYRAENLKIAPGSCGHQLDISAMRTDDNDTSHNSQAGRYKRETLKTTKYVELVIVADNREFQRQGKDVEKIKQRLIEIANYVDKFYRPLNIRVALVGVEVWNDMDKCSISQDPFTSLHEFLDWRKLKLLPRKPHDNAQLISGVYFQGTTIGMAPIMSMCTAEQSGGVVMDHSENPLGAAVTLAHELGHNFGMNHDTMERGCNCKASTDKGGCIMNPSTGFSNGLYELIAEHLANKISVWGATESTDISVQHVTEILETGTDFTVETPLPFPTQSYPFPMVFSSCSRKDLENSLEKGVGMCLFNLPEVKESFGGQKCGNGYVEDGEECDCGEPDLKPAGISCRESSNSCDLPEFCTGASPHCPANVYLHDGHACHRVDGYCYNGICQTHEQQCITLWGQGAKPAPGICFERVNSAGDPYGNCGKDSKSSFAKCEPRDAKCGKIQCQGGANRPVIGTNAVSIETNIPLQEGGKILCRGTHVYLGDDMPDPGLVLSGTKCEDGKICLNRRCQNTSVFGVHKCATKCHGRGVCNNKKNCHCEADWAPPYCDKPGFGGSMDSGPIRQADNKSLTIGVLITILCLIFAGSIMYLKRKTFMRWLFTSKKTTIEKLRSVSPARPSSSSEPNHVHTTSLSKNLIMKPQNTNTQKRDGPRRPLPYQIIDISNPVKTHNLPQLKTPQRVLPPLPQLPCHQAVPERPLPANPALRFAQEHPKPNPPRKPLPADPLTKARYNTACTTAPGHTKAPPHVTPVRPAPKHPPQVSRSSNTADVK
ncbi:disintegrin and metalloproteinase domain-containing protein 12 [Grus japonensis]|uniref:Disintegrin and metalloproteinase domain-containing protein 12 n=1 Tax=Grus japonensis TaxID=30415 RepID=A0ABC9X3E2_GRUJA